jgi:hypothetical protein
MPKTAKPRRFRRWLIWGPVLLASLLAGAWLGLRHSGYGKRADLAAGYTAHIICSCRYVGLRDMASCRTDLEPGTEIVRIEDVEARKTVIARVPLLATRRARFEDGYGCTLLP